jgi:hypothetical protein
MIFWESSLYNVEIFGSPVFAVRQWRIDGSCPQKVSVPLGVFPRLLNFTSPQASTRLLVPRDIDYGFV